MSLDNILYIRWKPLKAVLTSTTHEETEVSFNAVTELDSYILALLESSWDRMATIATTTGAVTLNIEYVRYSEVQEETILYVRFDRYELRLQTLDADSAEIEQKYLRLRYLTANTNELFRDKTRIYVSQTREAGNGIVCRSIADAYALTGNNSQNYAIIVEDGTYPEITIAKPIFMELQTGAVIEDTRNLIDDDNPASTLEINITSGQEVWIVGNGIIRQDAVDNFRGAVRKHGTGDAYLQTYQLIHPQGRVILNENGWFRCLTRKLTNATGGYTVLDSDGIGQYDIDAYEVETPAGLLFNQDLTGQLKKIHRHMRVNANGGSGVVAPAFNEPSMEYWFVLCRLANTGNAEVIYFFTNTPNDARFRLWDSVLYSALGEVNIADYSGNTDPLRIYPYGTLYSNRGILPNPYTHMYGQLTDY